MAGLPGEEVIGWYPVFDKDDFTMWKLRTLAFLHAIDYRMHDIIANGPCVPVWSSEDSKSSVRNKPRDLWTDEDRRVDNLDAKAVWYICNALPNDVFHLVKDCGTAKEMLETLSIVYEGTEEVKEAKKQLLIREFERFIAYEGETLTQTYSRFACLVSDLRCAGIEKDDCELLNKFIHSLPDQWNLMITILRGSGRIKTLTLADLYDTLLSHELLEGLKDSIKDTVEVPIKRSKLAELATMVSSSIEEESEDGSDEDDEELEILAKEVALLARRLRNLTRRRKLAKSNDYKKKPEAHQEKIKPTFDVSNDDCQQPKKCVGL